MADSSWNTLYTSEPLTLEYSAYEVEMLLKIWKYINHQALIKFQHTF
jgi:hypothetical protein